MTRRITTRTLAALTALGFLACGEAGVGPSDANTRVVLSEGEVASASVTADARTTDPAYATQADGAGATVSLDQVASITVDIDRIEVLKVDGEDGEGDDWFSLDVDKKNVDLLQLTSQGITVARGDLPEGDYRNVRFFLSNETITFSEDVTLGNENTGMTFEGGTEHDLIIPSADETGLKVPTATFSVEGEPGEDEMIEIVFDAGESVQTIVLTARGILMNPVLTATEPREPEQP